uniref:Uncharacterized protein n=1 Tax=Leersia perrieri TaxID=77586 RepID=A0A0D9X7T0_9ORYZ
MNITLFYNSHASAAPKMYVTRPLSTYLDNPAAVAEQPPDGPGSGFLVVEDEAALERATVCCGLCHGTHVLGLPFPQTRKFELQERDVVVFVPVVGEALSASRYYIILAGTGKHAGKVLTCSREEDKTACFFCCSCANDVVPREFDRDDVYQRVEVAQVSRWRPSFKAVAVAPDGVPPYLLRMKGGSPSPAVVVGRWYCPFMFIKEDGKRLKDQVKRCMFYEMTLEQSWQEIYTCNSNTNVKPDEVEVSVTVRRLTATLGGSSEAVQEEIDGVMWFRSAAPAANSRVDGGGIGLDMVVWERMKWELERGEWVAGDGDKERIERVERHDGGVGLQWNKFGCYLLLECFVLRRMDGSVALTCGFRHTNKIRTKWLLRSGVNEERCLLGRPTVVDARSWTHARCRSRGREEERQPPHHQLLPSGGERSIAHHRQLTCPASAAASSLVQPSSSPSRSPLLAIRNTMYVTRPISRYHDNPAAAEEPPPDGPGSGILVVEDEASVERAKRWWGLWQDREVYGLPFPQSRKLKVEYTTTSSSGSDTSTTHHTSTDRDDVVFVPVVGQPLSSGRYYAVRATGRHAGKVSACSREEDKTLCCFCFITNDVSPRVFDADDVYQQVKVVHLSRRRGFKAVAVTPDGIPPKYLRRKGWKVQTSASTSYGLTDSAHGTDWPLRHQMPNIDAFVIGEGGSPFVVVGKWYCPFMFIKDGEHQQLKDQAKRCMFYEMTLEQSWEEIYSCDNNNTKDEVEMSTTVHRSMAFLGGTVAVEEGGPQVVGGVMWFRPAVAVAVGGLGLEMVVWEQMKWELEEGGWVVSNGDVERIERVERPDEMKQWNKFGCYVLVERFVLRRMDGSVALTYEFRHTNKIRTKWRGEESEDVRDKADLAVPRRSGCAAEPPPDGPGSGILVVEDEAAIERATRWWGLWLDREVYSLPFPQSRMLKVEYTSTTTIGTGTSRRHWTSTDRDEVVFVPIVGAPLSSGRYYAVCATGRHAGKVSACSREEDKMTCCFCSCVNDVPPRPFDMGDVYQQHVEVVHLFARSGFKAVAVAPDGILPEYLRRKGWKVQTSAFTSYDILTDSAHGTDWTLCRRMPDITGFGGSLTPVMVGRWYCPFMFIKDGAYQQLKDQAKWCMFYEMTLEQSWEEIYSCDNNNTKDEVEGDSTPVDDDSLRTTGGRSSDVVSTGGSWRRFGAGDGGVGANEVGPRGGRVVGLADNSDVERIERVERPDKVEQWDKFGCYVLVERFVLRRMDGSVALTYKFRHTNKIRAKWA